MSEAVDPRVASVLEVLAGEPRAEVAARWAVDPALLDRWVTAFVVAGTAQVTNRPDADAASQRDRFLGAFAHELRSPLAVARGWVSMLVEDEVPPAAVARTLAKLDDALGRLADRIIDVELVTAASLGRVRTEPATVPVATLVAGLPGLSGADGDRAGGSVEVDEDLFRLVLRDLWQAASTLPTPRGLRLEVTEVAPWVEFRVVRDADPIEPLVLQALFEPFALNDDSTGVTIGLYLARALTVVHGGTIGVEQDDRGAVLWVRVPARWSGQASLDADEQGETP